MSEDTKPDQALRAAVVATAREMNALGINRGKSGNASVRFRSRSFDGYLITPSGMPYAETTPEDVVAMALNAEAVRLPGANVGANVPASAAPRLPSSEWRFHRDIYRSRDEVEAIVHTHAPFATALACLHRGIPAFHYMVAIAGGKDIRCAPYATFGTQELSGHAIAALEGRKACLLANHGMIAVGGSLAAALALAVEVETLAEMYWRALQAGEPVLLDDAEMTVVLEKFRTYGQMPGSPR